MGLLAIERGGRKGWQSERPTPFTTTSKPESWSNTYPILHRGVDGKPGDRTDFRIVVDHDTSTAIIVDHGMINQGQRCYIDDRLDPERIAALAAGDLVKGPDGNPAFGPDYLIIKRLGSPKQDVFTTGKPAITLPTSISTSSGLARRRELLQAWRGRSTQLTRAYPIIGEGQDGSFGLVVLPDNARVELIIVDMETGEPIPGQPKATVHLRRAGLTTNATIANESARRGLIQGPGQTPVWISPQEYSASLEQMPQEFS